MAGQAQDARVLAKPKMVTEYHSQISEFFHDLDKLSNIVHWTNYSILCSQISEILYDLDKLFNFLCPFLP